MAAIGDNWQDVWEDVWQSVWQVGGGGGVSEGDEVQVLTAGGIACSVFHGSGVGVRVVLASAKQISVVQSGGTAIKVTI